MKQIMLLALFSTLLSGCTGYPKNISPVKNFDLSKYLGKWYEIARLDHSFERGLEQVTAEYALRDDGGISVINRGFSREKNEWKEAKGKAYFVGEKDEGYLKVSFFGPFYGSYVIFRLDEESYSYAFVTGPSKAYLWLLSRTPTISDSVRKQFTEMVEELGYPTDELIFVKH